MLSNLYQIKFIEHPDDEPRYLFVDHKNVINVALLLTRDVCVSRFIVEGFDLGTLSPKHFYLSVKNFPKWKQNWS